jgi:hypothetical protein
LPGGQNYREVLMHLPENQPAPPPGGSIYTDEGRYDPEGRGPYNYRDENVPGPNVPNFQSAHWDQPNIVAHLRLNDRTGAQGENLLHMEELQSDWGQQGREQGFARPLTADEQEAQTLRGVNPFERTEAQNQRLQQLHSQGVTESLGNIGPIPQGPYVGNTQQWTDLGLKRALIEAANGPYTHLSWTPGQAQADRYDLSKQVGAVHWHPQGNFVAYSPSGSRLHEDTGVTQDDLSGLIGRDAAQKLMAQEPSQSGWRRLDGEDLSLGGQGMKGFYDNMVPKSLMKIAKKLDPNAKLGTSTINTTRVDAMRRRPASSQASSMTVPSMEITPLMRQQILRGLPQYRRGGRVGMADGGALEPVDHDPFAQIDKMVAAEPSAPAAPEPPAPSSPP